jgi:conjugative relaxase-like TrwC/TraI family protein
MAGVDPSTGRLLGTPHTERTVRGFDVTCSAPKSVSVLFAVGEPAVRREVLAGHDEAVVAVVDWVERHAHCRYRIDGKVCVLDTEGITAAVFRQHTSRALDPQLHTHAVIVNRVLAPDGRWLALDGRTIKRDQQTLSRLYHVGLRTELTRRLGVRWREPVNGIAEIAGVPDDALAEFSQRAEAVEARIEEKLERFTETFERLPTPRERWRLEREAVLDSRPPKADADPTTLEQEWRDRLTAIEVDAGPLLSGAVGVVRGVDRIDRSTTEQIVGCALAALAEQQSTWRVAELVRELAAAVPTIIAVPADRLDPWLDDLAEQVVAARLVDLSRPIPAGVPLRRDGRPITEATVDRLLTLPGILAEEGRLIGLAERRFALGGADRAVEAAADLDPPQRELAAAVAGDRALVLAVGPAGTGKTTALRPAVVQLRREGRAVFGVAPSAAAAEVLAVDAGVDADTVDKLLIEHALDRPPDHRYALPVGATVIVDETAMVGTPRLAELFELADRRDWRLALVGDPLQFAAVGRSGMFAHLVNTFGAIELGRVHRFNHAWERDASLRLRRGDLSVIDLYEQQGRLHGGTAGQMRRSVIERWWSAMQRGETALMMAPTNVAAASLNRDAQRRRLNAGELDTTARSVDAGPHRIFVADVVSTRYNARRLVTDRHLMVKNRDRWTVERVHRDGSLSVTGRTGRVRLPAEYVREHVDLGYAETSQADQGRDVDRSLLYLDGPTGAAGIYVPMTRGRESNEAFVVLRGEETPVDILAECLSRTWIDRPAVAVRAELQPRVSPPDEASESPALEPILSGAELRRLLERDAELEGAIAWAPVALGVARRQVASLVDERESLTRSINELEARLANARRTVESLDRPMVRRRRRVELDSARRQLDWLPRSIDQARAELVRLDRRQRQAAGQLRQAMDASKQLPALEAHLSDVQCQLDADARARGSGGLTDAILDRLGSRPLDASGARLWEEAAGRLAQHQAAWDLPDVIGRHPQLLGDDAYALSHQAAARTAEQLDRALGRVEIEPPYRSMGISL